VAQVTRALRRLHSPPRPRLPTLALCRRERVARPEPCQEIAVNNFFAEIARRCDGIRSFDDIAIGVAGIAFCACSAAMFAAVFVGAI
jgi:hypothetical protein